MVTSQTAWEMMPGTRLPVRLYIAPEQAAHQNRTQGNRNKYLLIHSNLKDVFLLLTKISPATG